MALTVCLVGSGIALAVEYLSGVEFSCGVCEGMVGIWDSIQGTIVGLVVLDSRVKDTARGGRGFNSKEVIWSERERERESGEREMYRH